MQPTLEYCQSGAYIAPLIIAVILGMFFIGSWSAFVYWMGMYSRLKEQIFEREMLSQGNELPPFPSKGLPMRKQKRKPKHVIGMSSVFFLIAKMGFAATLAWPIIAILEDQCIR